MSSEPSRKIEDLLKRYAEQRKAESSADFELHPATRNLLQGEVARIFEKSEGGKRKPLLMILWPRLAIAGAFTAILVLTVMVLNKPAERGIEIAQTPSKEIASSAQSRISEQPRPVFSDKAERSDLAKREAPAASPAPLTRSAAHESEIATQRGVAAIEARSEVKSSEPVGQVTSAEREKIAAKDVSADTFARVSGAVATTGVAPSSSAVGAAAPAQDHFYAETDLQHSWHFVQQDLRAKYRQNLLSPAQPKILQTFELSQTGNKIRLVDGDGSIYEGEILAMGQDGLGEKEGAKKSDESGVVFQVMGTNQQLNRVVSVSGRFSRAKENFKAQATTDAARSLVEKMADVTSGFVQGKVSIGGTNEFEIFATESHK